MLFRHPGEKFVQVLCLVQGGAGQLCSWVASNLTWAAGARLELSISNIQQVLWWCHGVIGGVGVADDGGDNLT